MNSNQKGNIAESKIISDLISKEYQIALPFGDMPFDLICMDKHRKLYKVQVKYCPINKTGSVSIRLGTVSPNSKDWKLVPYKPGDIDVFAVYIPDTDRCLYVRADEALKRKREFRIRIREPKVKVKNINFARNYEEFPESRV